MQRHFFHEGISRPFFPHFLPIIIPVSLMAYRRALPAIHPLWLSLPWIRPVFSFPVNESLSPARMIRVSGQRFSDLLRRLPVNWWQRQQRHDPSFSQQTDGKRRGKTLSDNHLFRCFQRVYRSGAMMRQTAGYQAADFYPVRIDKLAAPVIFPEISVKGSSNERWKMLFRPNSKACDSKRGSEYPCKLLFVQI